jgi:hypothetical protein
VGREGGRGLRDAGLFFNIENILSRRKKKRIGAGMGSLVWFILAISKAALPASILVGVGVMCPPEHSWLG